MSQAPPPPPPPPLPTPRRGPPPPERGAQHSVDKVLPEYLADSFAVGVETEFLLFPRSRNLHGSGLRDVAVKAASEYNLYLSRTGDGEHPKMHNGIDQAYHGLQFAEWTLDSDSTIEMPTKDSAPWGFENISPIFRVHRDSRWREHVTKMWSFLSENYQITANKSCGTHVHVSRAKGYSIEDLKRICASIIHFEPAFEALLPVDRLSNEYARSNWLDNPNFGFHYQRDEDKRKTVILKKVLQAPSWE
ncbi:hypothetical protein CCM_09018 [Cordyceps militaris CM01]|uniref:Amidoligase enzyme n=1 Tax=Cordyceps militaris (strain CM01) TaxID=983644 RepID=G3JSX5_CORMM|nr:uncharacterized protein CCM_09018 [Cordyceps militaris CM01]EGX88971.1 hypothetical protein CCM_09018 [Cordyceps militaris CM01]